jgi:hypothetical protein
LLVVEEVTILVAILNAFFAADDFLLGNGCARRDEGVFLTAISWDGGRRDGGCSVACVYTELCVLIVLQNISQSSWRGCGTYARVESVAIKIPLFEKLDLVTLFLSPHVAVRKRCEESKDANREG